MARVVSQAGCGFSLGGLGGSGMPLRSASGGSRRGSVGGSSICEEEAGSW